MDDLELLAEISNGTAAKDLADSESFKEVMETVKMSIYKRWMNTQPHEQDIREQLYLQMSGILALNFELGYLSRKGQSAQERLERKSK